MTHCVRKAAPLALVLLLALVAAASAGDNADVVLTITSPTELSGIAAGDSVELVISAAGMVGGFNCTISIEASPADAFDLSGSVTKLPGVGGNAWTSGVEVDGAQSNVGYTMLGDGNAFLDPQVFKFKVPASSTLTADTEASITVTSITIGTAASVAGTAEPDVIAGATLAMVVTVNPGVAEPAMAAAAGSETDVSLEFSPVGSAAGSAGEATFSVAFEDADGVAASGQAITWTVLNDGGEAVIILAPEAATVASGAQAIVSGTTTDGAASLTLDAEGGKLAASTSASVTATASAPNSAGEAVALSATFSASWVVAVPAELASFAGQITADDDILLTWGVASQTNNLGWEVFRSADNVVFERASGLVAGDGTTDAFRTYEFVDSDAPVAEVVYYYLRQIDLDGSASRTNTLQISFAPTALQQGVLPTVNALAQNYPNPFNPETTIQFDLSDGAAVTLTVYDATGQVVRTLMEGEFRSAGSYSFAWDGRNAAGHRVSSGVYMYELRAGDFRSMKKMTLVQ